jgi:acylpyruvate hydrolase
VCLCAFLSAGCTNLHHEVELGVLIGKRGTDISSENAMSHVSGFVLALDMTAREIQEVAKKRGEPWSVAKGYDTFCPISEPIPTSKIPDVNKVELWLKVNGQLRQQGSTSDWIFSLPTLVAHISRIFTLEEGDLILTGTPEGVGAVKPGDTITAGIKGLAEHDISFAVEHKYPNAKL